MKLLEVCSNYIKGKMRQETVTIVVDGVVEVI